MIICVLGMPGSGKSTIAAMLANKYRMNHVSAGDVARNLAKTDEETARALADGQLAPRDKMNDAMVKYLNNNTILDNYPRYFEQMVDLMHYAAIEPRFVMLTADFNTAVQRITDRGRGDDQWAQIVNRFDVFRDGAVPIIKWLLKRMPGSITIVSNMRTPENTIISLAHQIDIWRHNDDG